MVTDAMFEKLELNTARANACSPAKPAPRWRGLIIQAPAEIHYKPGQPIDGRFARIPICGFYRLDTANLLDGKPLLLVAVNIQDKSRISGPMIEHDHGRMAPRPNPPAPLRAKDVQGMASGAFFNPDLAVYLDLPAVDAIYAVHAEYGGMLSNVVQISIKRR